MLCGRFCNTLSLCMKLSQYDYISSDLQVKVLSVRRGTFDIVTDKVLKPGS